MKPAASGKRKLGQHPKFLCPIMFLAAFEAFKSENASEKNFFSLASIS
jgi:hypothetical protein